MDLSARVKPYAASSSSLSSIFRFSSTVGRLLSSKARGNCVQIVETSGTYKKTAASLSGDYLVDDGRDILIDYLGYTNIDFLSSDDGIAGLAEAQVPVEHGGNSCCGFFSRDSIPSAVDRVGPAVVKLSVSRGFDGNTTRENIGSGTIINPDGTILTCAHVVAFQGLPASSEGKVDVTLQDGQTFEGRVVYANFGSDIAFVEIYSKTPLPTAKLGPSRKLRRGHRVVAIGCPHSYQNTVTSGVVSYVGRKLVVGGIEREYLQTDCAMNAGNSGGPLVNIKGEVIGVNVMKARHAEGLNFAVPSDSVSKILEHFKKNGRFDQPWLELTMLDFNETVVAQFKERNAMFPNVNKGVLVPMVTPGSLADDARAGFCPGDVVLEYDRKPARREFN